jgi:hemolysin activation/secretion protein
MAIAHKRTFTLLLAATIATFSQNAVTAALSLPSKRPSQTPLEIPPFEPDRETRPLTVPAPTRPPRLGHGLPGLAEIFVKRFELVGNHVFDSATLTRLTRPFENRNLSVADLEELRYRLSLYYVEHGYINSGAIIPDQTVEDSVVTIQIIEGKLSDIVITGNRHLRKQYLEKRIGLGAGPPLNIVKLGETLQLLQDNARIKQLKAQLAPGDQPGQSVVDVQVTETRPYEVWIGGNNHQPPSVGGNQLRMWALHRSLTSRGDTLNVEYDRGDGLKEWNIGYRLPVTARDTEIGVTYNRIDSEVVESPFDDLDIRNDQETLGFSLTHPLYRSVHSNFSLGAYLDLRESKSYLFDKSFNFTPAAENGKTKITVARFSQEWVERSQRRVIAARSMFSRGLDTLDASVNGKPQDGKFTSWLGQFQWISRLPHTRSQLVLRANAQWTANGLPGMETFTIGGHNTVRGYRENRLVADKGITGSIELRLPLYSRKSPAFNLQLAPFADYGKVANNYLPDPEKKRIGSVGVGIIGSLTRRVLFDAYYGYPFRNFKDANDNIQDEGIHFNLSVRLL